MCLCWSIGKIEFRVDWKDRHQQEEIYPSIFHMLGGIDFFQLVGCHGERLEEIAK